MMSMQQQRQLIEALFVPYLCKCTVSPQGLISIQVRDPDTEALLLSLDGIMSDDLMTWGAISAFVENLQRDLKKLDGETECTALGRARSTEPRKT